MLNMVTLCMEQQRWYRSIGSILCTGNYTSNDVLLVFSQQPNQQATHMVCAIGILAGWHGQFRFTRPQPRLLFSILLRYTYTAWAQMTLTGTGDRSNDVVGIQLTCCSWCCCIVCRWDGINLQLRTTEGGGFFLLLLFKGCIRSFVTFVTKHNR